MGLPLIEIQRFSCCTISGLIHNFWDWRRVRFVICGTRLQRHGKAVHGCRKHRSAGLRLSLEARRANHAFLTLPIARQALLVVAPEYNRFAPVLAKPVRPELGALARGSLLQNYALAVGVARLTENPVAHAAVALAAADAEGETSLRRVLRSWPSAAAGASRRKRRRRESSP
jgi:hypothetical protein